MEIALIAIVIAIAAWWGSTGVVIMAVRANLRRPSLVLFPVLALAVAGLVTLFVVADVTTTGAVFAAFFAALAVWALHEVTFLLGQVTGPRKLPCPAEAVGWQRFKMAFAAIRDHELALFGTGLVLVVTFLDAGNPFGWAVYVLMWFMRLLTKFNVFLGAPNAISEILPPRMQYLTTYFRTDRTHPFFIVSVCIITALLTICAFMAVTATTPAATAGWSLMATFALLGLVEHLFLVLPVRDAALWGWALGPGKKLAFFETSGPEDRRPPNNDREETSGKAVSTAPVAG